MTERVQVRRTTPVAESRPAVAFGNGEAITADRAKCHTVRAQKAKGPAIKPQLGVERR